MVVTTEYVDISLAVSPMRTFVAAPTAEGRYPGIWCYSDIFQLTPPLLRTCVRLAGYGVVAAAPEIYRRIELPGTVIPFDDAGRTRGQQDAAKTPVAHFDADCRAGLDWLSKYPKSHLEKSAPWVSASAAISRFARRCKPMSAPRSVTTAQGSMTGSSVRTPMPGRWPAQEKSAVNF